VVVVGFGPTGKVLAGLLAAAGHRVAVVEKRDRDYVLPRAVSLDRRGAEVLDGLGIGDALRAHTRPAADYVIRDATGAELLRFALNAGSSGPWPQASSVYQPGLEAALETRLDGHDRLALFRGWTVVGLAERSGRVQVRATRDGAEETLRLRARYVVGCDGAGSAVRGLLGVEQQSLAFEHDWLACDTLPADPRKYPHRNDQIADPRRPHVAVSAGPVHRRWEFMRLPGDPPELFSTPAGAWELLAPMGFGPRDGELVRTASYRFGSRLALRWRVGSVLLAGDAAHQMPPFAGQGMCTGIADAACLGQLLDQVLRGGDAARLDDYEAARRPDAAAMLSLSVRLGRIVCAGATVDSAMSR
jgi:flavoprotein hydroxylase